MTRKATTETTRAPVRAPIHEAPRGRAVALDEEGNPIWRRSAGANDKYAIDQNIVPDGFVYEWKRHSVYNQPDPAYEAELLNNGWRFVNPSRHPGVFLSPNTSEQIIVRDGLALMCRPKVLNDEERAEAQKKANMAVTDAKRQHGLGIGDGDRTQLIKRRDVSFVNEHGVTISSDGDDI